MKQLVPRLPHAFFKWYCRPERYEEIHGDLEEVFYERMGESGLMRAQLGYWWDVIRCCQPYAWRRSSRSFSNNGSMFRSYFKISLRNLLKNPLSSFINVFGLAIAIGITLLVYTYMEYDRNIDQFHENKREVFLTTFFADREGYTIQYGKTPRPLAEILKSDFKQIKSTCRVEDREVIIKRDDHVFHEVVRFVDPEFLEMFSFPLISGTATSLADHQSIILSQRMSVKYFGDEDPIGREMLMVFNDSTKKVFSVTGVAEEFPKAHDIEFDFLVNFDNLQIDEPGYDKGDWSRFVNATLIQLGEPAEIDAVLRGMDKYRKLQNQSSPDWKISSFTFEPLITLHQNAANIKEGIVFDGNVEGRIGLPIIAIFMMVLACLNYINIAIVSATKRLKEIGIRKTIGANRWKVIIQFLTENLVVTCFALLMGIALCAFIFLPWFVNFTDWPVELKLINKEIWIFISLLIFFTAIASGIYPAVFVSRFDAVRIFRGSQEFGKRNPFTKIFLGAQLILACVSITSGVVFTQNHSFQRNQSWGYDQDNVVYAKVPDHTAFERLKSAMIASSDVLSASGSADHLGSSTTKKLVRLSPDQYLEVNEFAVDAGYFETMGLQLSDGRWFRKDSETDRQAVVINRYMAEKLALDHPVGQQIELDNRKFEVVGVLNDFHHRSFFHEIEPMIFTIADDENIRYLSLRVHDGHQQDVRTALAKEWSTLYPESPFQGGDQQDLWSSYFFSVNRSETFTDVIASIAVLLAALGVYGLVALNISGRMKELSIRRILGARIAHIFSVIIKQYRMLTLGSLIIGAPLSYWFAQAYLDMLFAYPMPLDFSGTAIAMVILVVVLIAVISTQITKVVTANAVTELKSE